MRRVSSNSSLNGGNAPVVPAPVGLPSSIVPTPKMSRNVSAQSLADMQADMQAEAMMPAPITSIMSCVEQYGFPSELLSTESKDFAACVVSPEEPASPLAPSPKPYNIPIEKRVGLLSIQMNEDEDARYNRLMQALLRRRRNKASVVERQACP